MKKTLLPLGLLFIAGAAFCQVNLSGKITGASKRDSIQVNVPFNGYCWKGNAFIVKPNAAGNFRLLLPYHKPVLAVLNYGATAQTILLSPGRSLIISGNKTSYIFSGTAAPENTLLKRLNINEPDSLLFIKEIKKSGSKSYVRWRMDSIFRIKLPAIRKSLDSTQKIVSKAAIPQSLKTIIHDEVKYMYAYALADKLGGWLNVRKNVKEFNLQFIDTVSNTFALPTKQQLDNSISANLYLENYFRFKMWKPMYQFKASTDKAHAEDILKDAWGITIKDIQNDPDNGNERYLFATHLKTVLPAYAWEKLLANEVDFFCMESQLVAADKMLNFIKINTPDNPHLADCERIIAPLKKQREKYASNLNIKIRADYKSINSMQQLLAPYKGKVVLIDMWGTWCPHCIEDMAYEPALKKHFENKDVVFLYLANDEDNNDEKWRDFIFINNLTGQHVRRTTQQIAPMWNELGIKDSDQGYPHYVIVGKEGNVLANTAKRPGNDGGLIEQIESALNKR